jgi:hypothetical protein
MSRGSDDEQNVRVCVEVCGERDGDVESALGLGRAVVADEDLPEHPARTGPGGLLLSCHHSFSLSQRCGQH